MQGSWNDTDPGQTVTINCQESSFERMCTDNGEWSTVIPTCEKQSLSGMYNVIESKNRSDFKFNSNVLSEIATKDRDLL